MPSKRKALAETAGNQAAIAPPSKKATKASSTAKKPVKPNTRKYVYSNPESMSGDPSLSFVNVAWPAHGSDDGDDDGQEEEDEEEGADVPKLGCTLTEAMIKKISKMGYPVTTEGIEKFQWMIEEQEKRDQDAQDMYVYNDFSGYGTTEMVENFLADFNKTLFKKDVSPFKKWAYLEALATWVKLACLVPWMMNDDGEGMNEIFNMIGTLILTCFDVLSEHGLLGPDSPLPNIGIIALLMIEFLYDTPGDIDSDWAHEVVRALDKSGVEIRPRKEVGVSQEKIDELREFYKEKETEEVEDGKNVYSHHAGIKFWSPEDDWEDDQRLWARWDWKKEYAEFKKNHKGGSHYDLTKWSKKRRAEYTFGTEECDKRMEKDYW